MICASKLVEELRMSPAAEPRLRISKILVPTDLSADSVYALWHALALAREFDAVVIVLHIVQLNIGGEELGFPRTQWLSQTGEEARSRLRGWIQSMSRGEVPTQIVIGEGRPHVEILDHARKLDADLIIMAAHRYAGLLRLLHPHTVVRVLRHAPCPVLVVGTQQRGFPEG